MCVTMMTKKEYELLPEEATPEMQRTPLASCILRLLVYGIMNNTSDAEHVMANFPSVPKSEDIAKRAASNWKSSGSHTKGG